MRTLKKTLCLVLALAMILGLGAFSVSATELKDDADVGVDYREAVEVLTTVGALKGDDKGNLNPKNEMTRAEAAIMIARLSKISEEAGIAPFNDCTDYNSFAGGAIAYCYYQGLINGDGNGNFMPGEPLTGYAFEKMLLCSLGYDAQIESLTNVGETWTIATAALAKKAGISWASLDGSKNLTREVAAKLVLNALKADKVYYENRGVTINNADGSSVRVANSAAKSDNTQAALDYIGAIKADAILQLGEDLYTGDLKLAASTEKDAFGRPASKWTYNNKEIITAASAPTVTFTASTGAADVATALSGYKIYVKNPTGAATASSYLSINNSDNYTGGTLQANDGTDASKPTAVFSTVDKADATVQITSTTTLANLIAGYTGNGSLVEIYADNNNYITKIVQVVYTLEKVSAINTNTAGDVTYTFSVSGTKTDFANGDDTVILHGTIAKDDYVTTTRGYNDQNKLHVYPTTIVTGQQTSVSNNKIVVSGNTYTIGNAVKKSGSTVSASDFENTTKDTNYYIDQYGYVVGHGDIETTKNYAAVLAIKATDGSKSVSGGKNRVQLRLAFSDGTTSTVDASKINGVSVSKVGITAGDATAITNFTDDMSSTGITVSTETKALETDTANAANDPYVGQIVSYTQTSSGYEVIFKNSNQRTVGADTKLIQNGYANIGNTTNVANAATIYVVRTNSTSNGETIKSYTGFTKVPTITEGSTADQIYARYVTNDNGKADFVFVNAFKGKSSDSSTDNVMYMFSNNNGITKNGTGSDVLYTLRGVLNGELNEAITSSSESFGLSSGKPEGGNFYKVTLDKTNNRVEDSGAVKATWTSSNIVTSANLDEIADNVFDSHVVNSSTTIYVITDSSSEQSVVKAESLAAAGITIGDSFALDVKDDTNNIDVLYFVKGATNGAVEIKSSSGSIKTSDVVKDNTKALSDAVDTGNTIYSTGSIETNAFTVTAGKTLTVSAEELNVSANEVITVQGTLNLYGDLTADANDGVTGITVAKGGTLNIIGTGIAGHITVEKGGKLFVEANNGLTIDYKSLIIEGGASASINAGSKDVTIKGLVRAYTNTNDTAAIDIKAGKVVIVSGGTLQAAYKVSVDASALAVITINGDLSVVSGAGLSEYPDSNLDDDLKVKTNEGIYLYGATLTVNGTVSLSNDSNEVTGGAVFTANSVLDSNKNAITNSGEVVGGLTVNVANNKATLVSSK